jgi:hypothetical protein
MPVRVDVFDRMLEDVKRKYGVRAASQPRMTELEVKRAKRDWSSVLRSRPFEREAFACAFENSQAADAQRYADDPDQLERVFRRMFRPVES